MALLARVRTVLTSVATGPAYSNLYFQGADSVINADACITAVKNFWTGITGRVATGGSWSIDGAIPLIDDTNGKIQSVVSATGQSGVFTGTGERLPLSNQLLVRQSTGAFVNGKRLTGQMFVPAMTETSSDAGVPNAAMRSEVAAAFMTSLVTPAIGLSIWSRPYSANPDKPNDVSRPGSSAHVISATVAPYWAILRSRRD